MINDKKSKFFLDFVGENAAFLTFSGESVLHNNGKNLNSDFDSLVLMFLCLSLV